MSSTEIGIEAARKILGDLALQVRRTGEPIILTRGNSRTPIARITPLEDTMTSTDEITATTVRDLHRHPNQAPTLARTDGQEITKADVTAAIDSYIEAGGEVDDQGEPDDWDVIANQLAADTHGETIYWSLVRGESPGAAAVEPHPLGVTIPDEVMAWAEQHGLSMEEPDVYLLVSDEQHAGEVIGEIGSMTTTGTVEDGRLIRAELEPGE